MYEFFLYGKETAENLIIRPVDERELASIPEEAEETRKLAGTDAFAILAVAINDWNYDLSPWKAPAVFGGGEFGDGAKELLKFINDLAEGEYKGRRIILGGYSLAGLFALWAGTKSAVFDGIVAASPSVWFPGFTEYLEGQKTLSGTVYLSLGKKESKTRNPVLSRSDECIGKTLEILRQQGIKCTLEWNEGNHFSEPEIRMAKGFAWALREKE